MTDDLIHFRNPDDSFDGYVAIGGTLTVTNLVRAYRNGIFPWPNQFFLPWCCPQERGILDFKHLRIPRSLAQAQRRTNFQFTIDQAFQEVITQCATINRKHESGTWITQEMIWAYCDLHEAGHAHSVEVWDGNELVGGLYGVDSGGAFAGESMFSFKSNASKLALLFLIDHLKTRGLDWIDIQMISPHFEALGAKEIPRAEFLERLAATQARKLDLFPAR